MKSQESFSIKKRAKSFVYAFNGIKILVKEEHNARIHLVSASIAIIAGLYFQVSTLEWIAITFSIGLVIAMEIFNSSIENMADFVMPEKNESIKKVKDLAAAGVLVSSLTATAVGLRIFIPKLMLLVGM
ncbi:MAG: diacylglycerol kinase family protein [Schleiferiaceae bacterium]|jgi:diacylglycerol kinase|nr:diacylglycerol kinase family protein [Schleiferiaceae bacterium]